MSRAQTLILALLIMSLLLGALCLVVAREQKRATALRWWGWGALVYALGLFVTQQQSLRPASIILGNALIAWVPILCAQAVLQYTPRRLANGWTYSLLVAAILAIVIANTLDWHPRLITFNAPTLVAVIVFVAAIWRLLQAPPEHAVLASRLLVISMIFSVVVWCLRAAFLMGAMGKFDDRDTVDFIVALFAIAQIVTSVASTMALFWVEVQRNEAALVSMALSDPLTGVANRRAVIERFAQLVATRERTGTGFALIAIDLDHFKRINDEHGHHAGDAVLKHAAAIIDTQKRVEDVLGRIGGEEFVLLLPGQDAASGAVLAERVRAALEANPCPLPNHAQPVTLSAGVAACPADGTSWDTLFGCADVRCYAAKTAGRNRVVAR
jgi:diguanylate cyclase (GGDEF)-like protein